jgi:hypothetical protein
MSNRTKIAIAVGAVIILILLVLLLIFFLNNPTTTETIRDIFIILIALETLIIGTLLVILVIQLISLISMLREDIKPIIDSTRDTVTTVRGTANFMSDQFAQPAIKASGYAAGIKRSISVLVDMLPRRK